MNCVLKETTIESCKGIMNSLIRKDVDHRIVFCRFIPAK